MPSYLSVFCWLTVEANDQLRKSVRRSRLWLKQCVAGWSGWRDSIHSAVCALSLSQLMSMSGWLAHNVSAGLPQYRRLAVLLCNLWSIWYTLVMPVMPAVLMVSLICTAIVLSSLTLERCILIHLFISSVVGISSIICHLFDRLSAFGDVASVSLSQVRCIVAFSRCSRDDVSIPHRVYLRIQACMCAQAAYHRYHMLILCSLLEYRYVLRAFCYAMTLFDSCWLSVLIHLTFLCSVVMHSGLCLPI